MIVEQKRTLEDLMPPSDSEDEYEDEDEGDEGDEQETKEEIGADGEGDEEETVGGPIFETYNPNRRPVDSLDDASEQQENDDAASEAKSSDPSR